LGGATGNAATGIHDACRWRGRDTVGPRQRSDRMKRRDFHKLIGGAVASSLPAYAACAQQAGKLPTVGFLIPGTPDSYRQKVAAALMRLRELGWIEGRTVAIEYRWAEGRGERFDEIAAEFVRLKVDVIFSAGGTPPVVAARKATSEIPIIFVSAGDPVGSGLVASLARPGRNVTGVSNQTGDIAGKRVELLRELLPDLRRLAILVTADNGAAISEMHEVQRAAGTLGIETVPGLVRNAEDIAAAVDTLKNHADALYVVIDPLVSTHPAEIGALSLEAKIPTMHGSREFVEAGGLISYGANLPALWRRSADYIDKILRGAKPANVPVEQPTEFDLIINLRTAKAFGLAVPSALLARADEVVE
jgi:putative ABC transport system substrate-binding protein